MTQTSETPFASVFAALEASVRTNPGKVAIVFENEQVAYQQLLERIENTARHLRLRGIGKGDTFAAFAQNRPELLYCYYAAAMLGALFVPLNPNLTQSEVEYSFGHSGAKVLFYDDVVAQTAKGAVADDALIPMARLAEILPKTEIVREPVQSDDDFLIIYTSGSTGTPKAIVLDHEAQVGCPIALSRMWGVTGADRTLVALPLGYLYGLSTAAAAGLQAGGTVVILRRFHPREVLEAFIEHKASVFHGVPTMFSMMLEYCEQRELQFDLSGMRKLICAGAPLSEEMARRFTGKFSKELENYYALTECTPVFGRYFDDTHALPEGSIGRAAPGAAVKVLRVDGTECDVNEDGELLVRAAATMKRYLKNPEMTEASMMDDLFRTGDLVKRDEHGFFYITGRIKEIIIRGGANISPSEVEKVLISHPGVQDAAVIGMADRIFGEIPVAVVVRRHGSDVTQEELVAHVESLLSDFKVPRTIFFETELPQGKTGKTDKRVLRERFEPLMAAS
ncbi:AMP-dependent synthetase [Rhizobium sp. Root1203]|uniref:class I adenylate-forming enzyme family protein n=1 Tax=Rhizobium sp. Root1203 TaxID=1736427 RepID=UPI00070EE810|nr:class I adenylate-forming enzyme family protein [Rhizobium sp. Root1203]KQV31506.1 AMP-dependent synthetase [Rhizobium sp. Root1203]